MTEKKKYDSTVARIAATEHVRLCGLSKVDMLAELKTALAALAAVRAIVAEVARTEPETGGEGA